MAVTVVQRTTVGEGGGSSNTAVMSSSVTAGNALLVAINLWSADGATNEIDMAATNPVTDTLGNTFTPITAAEVKQAGVTYYHHLYYYLATGIAGGADTITTTFARNTWNFVTAYELTPCQFDQATTATGTLSGGTGTVSAGTLTPSANGALGLVSMNLDSSNNAGAFSGWAVDRNGSAGGGTTFNANFPQTTAAALAFEATANSTGIWSASGVALVPPGSPVHGSATLAATAALTASGQVVHRDSATLASTLSLTATGQSTPIAFVQRVASGTSASGTTATVTLAANTTVGHRIILALRGSGGHAVTGVTDSKGNTWTVDKVSANTSGQRMSVASAPLTTALLTGDTITVTLSGSGSTSFAAYEYSGIASSSPVDTTGQANATTGTSSTLSVTTTVNGDLIFGIVGTASNQASWTVPASFTERATGQASVDVADFIQATAGAQAENWSWPTTSSWGEAVVAYKATTGGSSVTGQATLASTFALATTGQVTHRAQATLASALALTATGQVTHRAQATLASTVTLTATGRVTHRAQAGLTSSFTLTASGHIVRGGHATLGSTFSLAATGSIAGQANGHATLTAALGVTATGQVFHRAQAALTSTLAFTATASIIRSGQATLASTLALTAQGAMVRGGRATLSTTLGLTARASVVHRPTADLAFTFGLSATGSVHGTQAKLIVRVALADEAVTSFTLRDEAATAVALTDNLLTLLTLVDD